MAQPNMQEPKAGLAARRAALGLLSAVLDQHELLNTVLEARDGPLRGLSPEDRARAQRLALSTLRQIGRADACLKPFLRKDPPEMVRLILRLATVELCQDGAAPHGVVDCAVTLTRKQPGGDRLSGMVNAVLRRVAEAGPERWSALQPTRLPNWLRGRLQSAYGNAVVARMEAAHAEAPPLDLTAKVDPPALAERLGGVLTAGGSVRLSDPGQVSTLPGYAEGDWWVQDAAAALPAKLIDATAGQKVLDLCAAPGGKTLQLAAAGASVTALDISGPRLARLRENLQRTGLTAEIVVADALHWQGGSFDAILLDAPCSASGTLRRHPDLPFVKSATDLKPLVALQSALLDHALSLLAPGGQLVFCTCSLLPEEGEVQIRDALSRHADLSLDSAALEASWIDPLWRCPEGLRLRSDYWPEQGGLDGFFIAPLRKNG